MWKEELPLVVTRNFSTFKAMCSFYLVFKSVNEFNLTYPLKAKRVLNIVRLEENYKD